jgi:hypothetical protein
VLPAHASYLLPSSWIALRCWTTPDLRWISTSDLASLVLQAFWVITFSICMQILIAFADAAQAPGGES